MHNLIYPEIKFSGTGLACSRLPDIICFDPRQYNPIERRTEHPRGIIQHCTWMTYVSLLGEQLSAIEVYWIVYVVWICNWFGIEEAPLATGVLRHCHVSFKRLFIASVPHDNFAARNSASCIHKLLTKVLETISHPIPFELTHWGRDDVDAISQPTFWNAFSWMKIYKFRLRYHCFFFLRVQLTIFQHWFR